MELALGISISMIYLMLGIILHLAYAVRAGFKRTLDMEQDFNPEVMFANVLFYPLYLKRHIDTFFRVMVNKGATGLNSHNYTTPGVQHYQVDFTTTVGDFPDVREEKNKPGNIFDPAHNRTRIRTIKKKQTTNQQISGKTKAGTIFGINYATVGVNTYDPEKIRLKYAA